MPQISERQPKLASASGTTSSSTRCCSIKRTIGMIFFHFVSILLVLCPLMIYDKHSKITPAAAGLDKLVDVRDSTDERGERKENKPHLTCMNNSGFSNQLVAIHNAAFLALATGRILVLPSVLPHAMNGNHQRLPSMGYKARSIGNKCLPYERCRKFVRQAEMGVLCAVKMNEDADKNLSTANPYLSFQELLDFEDVRQNTDLQIVDMTELARDLTGDGAHRGDMLHRRQRQQSNVELLKRGGKTWWFIHDCQWCQGNSATTLKMEDCIMTTKCNSGKEIEELKDNFTFVGDLVPCFQKVCPPDRKVAVIGSACTLRKPDKASTAADKRMADLAKHLGNVNPSQNMLNLINEILRKSGIGKSASANDEMNMHGCVSVHIRFKDDLKTDDCDDPIVKEGHTQVLNKLDVASNKTKAKGSTPHVLIGNGHKSAKRCFHHFAQGRHNAFTINDVIDADFNVTASNDRNNFTRHDVHQSTRTSLPPTSSSSSSKTLNQMLENVQSDKIHAHRLLDQILIALADTVVLSKIGATAGTFQHAQTETCRSR